VKGDTTTNSRRRRNRLGVILSIRAISFSSFKFNKKGGGKKGERKGRGEENDLK